MAIYSLFGLRVSSELPLPEVAPGEGAAEVAIRLGKVPDELPDATKRTAQFEVAPGRLRLEISGVASFLVSHGNEILIEPAAGAEESEIRVFLLGSAMGALLQQRGFLPLHASAVESRGRAVLFAGDSGLGKSTLAAAFHAAGHRVVADDVTAVRVGDDGVPVAYPAYPELKLWADALDKLGLDAAGLPMPRPQVDKSRLPVDDFGAADPLPITDIYLLEVGEDEPVIEPIAGMSKLDALARNTYRGCFLEGSGIKQAHFRLSVALARHARLARVVRPRAFRLDELVGRIARDLAARAA